MDNNRLMLVGNILDNSGVDDIPLSCQENSTPPPVAIPTILAIVPSPHLLTHLHCTGAIHSAPIIHAKQFIFALKYVGLIFGGLICGRNLLRPYHRCHHRESCIVHRASRYKLQIYWRLSL